MRAIVIVQRNVPLLQASFPFPVLPVDGPAYVYVMGWPRRRWSKVGSTHDLRSRLRSILSESQTQELALYFALEHARYRKVERQVQLLLGEARAICERFRVTPECAIAAVRKVIAAEGEPQP